MIIQTMSEYELLDIFADNLRDLMNEVNISKSELARKALVSRSTIVRILKKERMPSLPTLINICHVCGVTLDEMVPTYDLIY